MNSLILQTATRFVVPMLLLLSAVITLQGHNIPGGGFIGGLVASSAFALHAIAFSPASTRSMIRVDLIRLVGIGLTIAIVSALISAFTAYPVMTGLWTSIDVPGVEGAIKVGTPLLFDVGVYITVIAVVLTMIITLQEHLPENESQLMSSPEQTREEATARADELAAERDAQARTRDPLIGGER